jgi:hypothetical protein
LEIAFHVIYQNDLELRAEDIQILNDADGVAALFSRLGYETAARTVQSPGNLGITADTLLRRIKRIELIADNEGFFQVYRRPQTNVPASWQSAPHPTID